MLFSNHFLINYYEGTIDGIVISAVCSYVINILGSLPGIGLLLEGISYETGLSRIDYIATKVSSFEEFDLLVLQGPITRRRFQNSTLRTVSPQQHNTLHHYRFGPLSETNTTVDATAEKVNINGDKILKNIPSCFGVETAVLPSIQEAGFLDIPKIFSW